MQFKLCMKESESNQTLLSNYWVPSAGLNPLEREVKVWELFCGTQNKMGGPEDHTNVMYSWGMSPGRRMSALPSAPRSRVS